MNLFVKSGPDNLNRQEERNRALRLRLHGKHMPRFKREDNLQFVYNMAAKANTKRGILPGYFESLQQKESKERYIEKLKSIEGQDPFEISRKERIDDVDCWPDVTYINVGMYLLFAASPYTQEQLMNYKSLDCYQNFVNGWVREVLCKKFGENRLFIAKVRFYNYLLKTVYTLK